MLVAEFVNISTWIVKLLFFVGLLPQIYINYKLRSTSGMSDWMLLGYFNGYLLTTFYVFCLDLPPSYKLMVPLSLFAVFLLVIQRFSYDKDRQGSIRYYVVSIAFAMIALVLAFKHPTFVGHLSGWLAVGIWTLYQIPQVAKIYHEKSVVGYSFLLVTAIGLGNFAEVITAYVLDLPGQTIVSSLRGIIIYLIFLVEFIVYRRRKQKIG